MEGGDRKRKKRRKKVHISRKEYDELLKMVPKPENRLGCDL